MDGGDNKKKHSSWPLYRTGEVKGLFFFVFFFKYTRFRFAEWKVQKYIWYTCCTCVQIWQSSKWDELVYETKGMKSLETDNLIVAMPKLLPHIYYSFHALAKHWLFKEMAFYVLKEPLMCIQNVWRDARPSPVLIKDYLQCFPEWKRDGQKVFIQ